MYMILISAVNELATGQTLIYAFEVSTGINLTFKVSGGSGDMDLYVKFGSVPSKFFSDFSSMKSGNDHIITVPSPMRGK